MTHQLTTKPVNILLVEDNPGDVRLTQEALKDANMGSTLHAVKDGVEALAFLRRQDGHADAPRPDLILLDLNLPRKSGHEVLAEIKEPGCPRMKPCADKMSDQSAIRIPQSAFQGGQVHPRLLADHRQSAPE